MALSQVDSMVRAGAMAEDVMAYLVLARGVNRRGNKRISTHSANSIVTRTGMSHRKATESVEWLRTHGYISPADQKTPEQTDKGKGHRPRWLLVEAVDTLEIYLANALTDGVGGRGKKNPPLTRIYAESMNQSGLVSEARLDSLMVLLHLYRHQDIEACGGIDPRAGIYREWVTAENTLGESKTELPGTNAALYEVASSVSPVFTKFAAEALFYIPDEDERHHRFRNALRNLHRLNFVYEVLQVWSGNPNGKDGRKAEPLYTLYIHDRHAREREPYLSREIHNAAIRLDAMDGYAEFAGHNDDGENILHTGRFRYVATSKQGAFPIGIYRLNFRPNTREVGIGIDAERSRVQKWAASLNALK